MGKQTPFGVFSPEDFQPQITPVEGSVAINNFPGIQPVSQSTTPWIVSGSVSLDASAIDIGRIDQGLGNAAGSPWSISGAVTVLNASSNNQGIGNAGGSPWAVSGMADTVLFSVWDQINNQLRTSATLSLSGGLNVGNVGQGTGNAGGSPWAVSGSVTVTNALSVSIPNPLGVSGTVTVLQSTTPWIVSGGVDIGAPLPAGTNIIGKVSQDTSPWITSGGVTVSNFPTTQSVTQGTIPWIVSGGVEVSQLPAASGLADLVPNPTTTLIGAMPHTWDGTAWTRAKDITFANTQPFPGSGIIATGVVVFDTVTAKYNQINSAASAVAGGVNGQHAPLLGTLIYDGFGFYNVRTPSFYKTVSATASGSTVLWTPNSGKKFRLMKFMIQVTDNASLSSGAVLDISLLDGNTNLNLTTSTFIPTTAITTTAGAALITPWVTLDNGILSSLANNLLSVSLDSTLVTGIVRVTACGTEE